MANQTDIDMQDAEYEDGEQENENEQNNDNEANVGVNVMADPPRKPQTSYGSRPI